MMHWNKNVFVFSVEKFISLKTACKFRQVINFVRDLLPNRTTPYEMERPENCNWTIYPNMILLCWMLSIIFFFHLSLSFSLYLFVLFHLSWNNHHLQQVTKVVEACECPPTTQMTRTHKPVAHTMDRQATPAVAVAMLRQKRWATKGNLYKATKAAAVYQLLAKITTKRQCYWVVMMNTNKLNT